MRGADIIAAFELEINKLDDVIQKPITDDSVYWINQGIFRFVKDGFSGNTKNHISYEQTEKRSRDLIKLLKEGKDIQYNSYTQYADYDCYEYTYPTDLMFVLNEDVEISDTNDKYKTNTCVFECTADNFMFRINNSLTDFHYRYHRARPIRVRTKDGFRLLTDKKYKIQKYTVGYLKTPEEVVGDDPTHEYNDFEYHTWIEIIKIAAKMYIENHSDQRYNTISNEVVEQQ